MNALLKAVFQLNRRRSLSESASSGHQQLEAMGNYDSNSSSKNYLSQSNKAQLISKSCADSLETDETTMSRSTTTSTSSTILNGSLSEFSHSQKKRIPEKENLSFLGLRPTEIVRRIRSSPSSNKSREETPVTLLRSSLETKTEVSYISVIPQIFVDSFESQERSSAGGLLDRDLQNSSLLILTEEIASATDLTSMQSSVVVRFFFSFLHKKCAETNSIAIYSTKNNTFLYLCNLS